MAIRHPFILVPKCLSSCWFRTSFVQNYYYTIFFRESLRNTSSIFRFCLGYFFGDIIFFQGSFRYTIKFDSLYKGGLAQNRALILSKNLKPPLDFFIDEVVYCECIIYEINNNISQKSVREYLISYLIIILLKGKKKLESKRMKKTQKYLRFENLKIQLQQIQPKQVSRAVLCFKEQGENVYKTHKYGQVTPLTIEWEDAVEIPFSNQQTFIIETICEHQYGYQLQQLEATYNGQVYIKTQNFFRPLTIHIFNKQGQKCGILKYLIKVIEKQIVKEVKKVQVVQEQPSVKVDLIGKITLFAAAVNIIAPSFKKDKYVNDFTLIVYICGQKAEATYKKYFQWNFPAFKVEYMENSPDQVAILLKNNNQVILQGRTTMKTIMENKRFVTHSITLYNANEQKIGILKLDLRFITKQQLLDLLYSPTKLSKQKQQNHKQMQKNDSMINIESRKSNPEQSRAMKARANSSMITTHKNSQISALISQNILQNDRSANRYKKVHVTNSYNQIIFSKAKRFSEPKNVNPYVSYSDPHKFSDFSPDNKNGYHHSKGPDISTSKKTDFTRPFKNHPGVGQYKLPSIWDKY